MGNEDKTLWGIHAGRMGDADSLLLENARRTRAASCNPALDLVRLQQLRPVAWRPILPLSHRLARGLEFGGQDTDLEIIKKGGRRGHVKSWGQPLILRIP